MSPEISLRKTWGRPLTQTVGTEDEQSVVLEQPTRLSEFLPDVGDVLEYAYADRGIKRGVGKRGVDGAGDQEGYVFLR